MTVLIQKMLTRTDLGAPTVKSIRISLAKAQVRGAIGSLLECGQSDDVSSTDQALEALAAAAVPLSAVDPSGASWELLLKSTYRAGHQAFFVERAGEFLRSCDAQPGDIWQLIRHGNKLAMRLVKQEPQADGAALKQEEAADEACSSDVSDQQAIPECVRGPSVGLAPSPPVPRPAPRHSHGAPSPPVALADMRQYGSSSSLASCQIAAGGAMGPPSAAPSGASSVTGDRKRPAAVLGAGDDAPGAKRTPGGSPASGPAATPPLAPQHSSTVPQAPAALSLPPAACSAPQSQAAAYHAAAPAPAAAWQGGWVVQQQPQPAAPAAQYPAAAAHPSAAAAAQPSAAVAAHTSAATAAHHPHQLPVTCNGLHGLLDATTLTITVVGPHNRGSRVLPEVFEALAGKSTTRKWRRSLVVHPGAADPSLLAPTPIGDWLARYPHLEACLPPRGSGRAAARAALGAMGDAPAPAAAAPASDAPRVPRASGDGRGSADGGPRVERKARADGAQGAAAAAAAGGGSHGGQRSREPSKPRTLTIKTSRQPDAAAPAGAGAAPAQAHAGGAAQPASLPPSLMLPGGGVVRWLPVQCIDLGGWLDLTDLSVLMLNPRGEACRMSPAEFEAMAGKGSTRKWRRSLVVQPGGDDPRLAEPLTVGEWMRRHGVAGALGSLPGTSALPPPGGAAPAAAAAAPAPAPRQRAAAASAPGAAPAAAVAAPPPPLPQQPQPVAPSAGGGAVPLGAAPRPAGYGGKRLPGSGLLRAPSGAAPWAHQLQPKAPHLHPSQARAQGLWPPHAPPSPPPRTATPQLPGCPPAPAAPLPECGGSRSGGSDESDGWLEDLLCCDGGGIGIGMAALSDLGVEVAGAARLSAAPAPAVRPAGAEEDDGAATLILAPSSAVHAADWLATW
ncbi:hypothetical protein Rsub_01171 [Raphidocelis subcapitata]|uniref:Uncharacterized protein n=1 Tax=Raphidocelis subcapitata TaxID=307507 RepID=A0A2V0NLX9_9CHLO|nr:hypothetical protein Rsub_01171 [Raphidocelis subcapitata]|eukprot:GBF88458.1 hypothetical protein Rsub_01171 [Raphidocelis subcapitata]